MIFFTLFAVAAFFGIFFYSVLVFQRRAEWQNSWVASHREEHPAKA